MALLFTVLPAVPVGAAGTGGIEVTPLPAVVDGKQVTAFHVELPGAGPDDVEFLLRNVADGQRAATVYAARATRSADGSFDVGDAGSSPYVSYAKRSVTLGKGEQRPQSFRVERPKGKQPSQQVFAAIVVEVGDGSVIQRAATLVYLDPGRQLPVPLPLLLVAVAGALLALAGAGVALVTRRRRRRLT